MLELKSELLIPVIVTINDTTVVVVVGIEGLGVVDVTNSSDEVDMSGGGVITLSMILISGTDGGEELVAPAVTRSSVSFSWTYVDTLLNSSNGAVMIVLTTISVPTTVITNLMFDDEMLRENATAAMYDSVNELIEAL